MSELGCDLWPVLNRSLRNTANVVFIIAKAAPFAWLLLGLSDDPIVILLIINLMLLVIGGVMDNIAAMIILSTIGRVTAGCGQSLPQTSRSGRA